MAPDAVFLDASGWIAILSVDDWLHPYAVEQFQSFEKTNRHLITTDWVLAEAGNGLARPKTRGSFVSTIKSLFNSPLCRIISIERPIFLEALDLYRRVSDKSWGLIDCSSFVVMRREGITDSLTADRHFSQAGFRCLLPTSRPNS